MQRKIKYGLIGLIVGIGGTLGTYYQIFGESLIWIVLAALGGGLIVYFLWSLLRELHEVVSTFGSRWRMLEGRLKIGNTINVALRAYTVQRILRHVEQALGEGASSQLLRQAGRDCGESFAQELRAELIQLGENSIVKSGKTSETFRKKLDLWARYDSSTGMGVFDVSHVVLDGNLLKGRIVIRNSFLAFDRHTESHTCSFLEGYIEGVVLHLVDVDTTVRETSCSSITGNGECVFEFAKSAQGIVGTAIFSRA